ncbi:MAG: type II toxin-antitoxin system RelE/ParE family toxin [Caldilineales bacterium]|nr:type II toxin-antitoxin system RelE/ParE family toxin [Caldilineales bacterium]MCX7854158.1 type II toxin-antitoxin system RelE/ParE family toxin [Caldilineales bacterium]
MTGVIRFEIIFGDAVEAHFAAIERKDHGAILDAIEQQLSHEAAIRTANRKPLRIPNAPNATWELRCGANNRYRVFYDVNVEDRFVVVLAVGRKHGNRLVIGNEEFEL